MKAINKITLGYAAEISGGRLQGDPAAEITGANTIENARKGDITFLSNPRYRKWLDNTSAACVLVSEGLETPDGLSVIISENPSDSFRKILEAIYVKRRCPFSGISPLSSIDPSAYIGRDACIADFTRVEAGARIGSRSQVYPGCYAGRGVQIGEDCVLYPGVTLMDDVVIGNRVIINSGTVIGSEGFGFVTTGMAHVKIPQVGGVVVGDDVEIGANASIDRGSPGDTVIGEGTKIDNLVQIAHNVKIGRSCIIVAQAGIAGSTVIGDGAVLAGQAGVVGHIKVGEGAKIGAQAGVTRDVKPGQLVSGYPAMEHAGALRINALIRRLPKLFKQVEKLENEIKER